MKHRLKVILVAVAVLAVAAAGLLLGLDSFARHSVQSGATFALEVPAAVDSMSIELAQGRLALDGLVIANPSGFRSPHLMRLDHLDSQLEPATLVAGTMVLTEFRIKGLEINIEQSLAGLNTDRVLASLKRLSQPSGPARDGKKIRLDRVVLEGIRANYYALGADRPRVINVPPLELTDVAGGKGQTISVIVARIMPAVIAATLRQEQARILPAWLQSNGDAPRRTDKTQAQ